MRIDLEIFEMLMDRGKKSYLSMILSRKHKLHREIQREFILSGTWNEEIQKEVKILSKRILEETNELDNMTNCASCGVICHVRKDLLEGATEICVHTCDDCVSKMIGERK